MTYRIMNWLSISWKIAWVAMLVVLPVTSFPLVSRLAGGTSVAPLAFLPLMWLCLTQLPFDFFKRNPLPAEHKPLIAFMVSAILSSLLAYFTITPPYKGHSPLENNIEALVTLAAGILFFLVMVIRNRSLNDLDKTLMLITIGGVIVIAWALFQGGAAIIFQDKFPAWINRIQHAVSISAFRNPQESFRLIGTTFEPSWLAHLLNMLYLSLWMGASSAKYSSFRFRILGISLENLLLIAGIAVLVFTYSRIGLAAFIMMVLWFLLQKSRSFADWFSTRVLKRDVKPTRGGNALSIILVVVFVVLIVIGLVLFLSTRDQRFANILNPKAYYQTYNNDSFLTLANRLNFAERVVYWQLGWNVFQDHPFFGVGLGNIGMFTMTDISFYAWKLPELHDALFKASFLPNAKSLWVRILGETGLVGFSVFIAWLIVLWMSAQRLQRQSLPVLRAAGFAGQYSIIALILEGFSVDSYALPYLWVAMGIVSAASLISRRNKSTVTGDMAINVGSS